MHLSAARNRKFLISGSLALVQVQRRGSKPEILPSGLDSVEYFSSAQNIGACVLYYSRSEDAVRGR